MAASIGAVELIELWRGSVPLFWYNITGRVRANEHAPQTRVPLTLQLHPRDETLTIQIARSQSSLCVNVSVKHNRTKCIRNTACKKIPTHLAIDDKMQLAHRTLVISHKTMQNANLRKWDNAKLILANLIQTIFKCISPVSLRWTHVWTQ